MSVLHDRTLPYPGTSRQSPMAKDFEKRSDGTERRRTRGAGGGAGGWAGGAEMARGRAARAGGTNPPTDTTPAVLPPFPRPHDATRPHPHARARPPARRHPTPQNFSLAPLDSVLTRAYVPGVPGHRAPAERGKDEFLRIEHSRKR